MSTLELLEYYVNLLILQYHGKPKAQATIRTVISKVIMAQTSTQEIFFSDVASSGQFILSYEGNSTSAIQWNDSTSTIQNAIQALPGLSQVTVTGSIAGQSLEITFTGVIAPAFLLTLDSSTLSQGSSLVTITIQETDVTLPLAVQNGYNLIGNFPAVGVQLDILGKYAGVTRNGTGFQGNPIILSDPDFLSLIKLAIATNSNGSSLYDIVSVLNQFFPGQILTFDFTDMRLSYLIAETVGSMDLLELAVRQNLVPHPMAVGYSIIYAPTVNSFFGFVSYDHPVQPSITRPLNTYDDYQTSWLWLSYSDGIFG